MWYREFEIVAGATTCKANTVSPAVLSLQSQHSGALASFSCLDQPPLTPNGSKFIFHTFWSDSRPKKLATKMLRKRPSKVSCSRLLRKLLKYTQNFRLWHHLTLFYRMFLSSPNMHSCKSNSEVPMVLFLPLFFFFKYRTIKFWRIQLLFLALLLRGAKYEEAWKGRYLTRGVLKSFGPTHHIVHVPRAGDRVTGQPVGCLPCRLPAWVQSWESHMVTWDSSEGSQE